MLEFCTITGDLAGDDCTETAYGWYKPSNIPPECDGDHDVNNTDEEDSSSDDEDEDRRRDDEDDEDEDRRRSRDDDE